VDDAEFEAAMAAQMASDEETPIEETETEAPSEETPQAELEPDVVAELDEPEEVVETEAPQYGEEVSAYLSKYGGDVEKALAAAIQAQSKIGEQGQELGELRRMVQEIVDRPEPRAPVSPFITEQLQEAIDTNPSQVATWAIQNENPHVYEAALSEWYDQDPKAAIRFEISLNRELAKQEAQAQFAPEIESVREREKARALSDAHRTLADKYPDFQQVLESATSDEVAGIDRNLLATVLETNPAQAQEMIYRWVKGGRDQKVAEVQAQRTDEVRAEKRQAAVVTADASVESTTEPTVLEKLEAFMLEPDPWDVRSGLNS
jgi:hypothetical protein